MPSIPANNTCSLLGCHNPRSKLNTLCLQHGGGDSAEPRNSDKVYKTASWQSIRKRQISMQPLCQSCLLRGIVTPANTVDHVFPWNQIGEHAFTHNIFQSLCPECHSYKTGQEQQGKYEHYTDKLTVYGKLDYFYEK